MSTSKPVSTSPIGILGNRALVAQHHAKCLGYWWSWDLSATRAIDEAIKRARRAFFAFGAMGTFHGKLNPISSKTIFDTCVVPILLYGCENWILTSSSLDRLEAFQGEIGRRILKLSKFHSSLSTRLALRWPSVAARILIRKLNLLSRISSEEESTSGRIFSHLAATDPQSLQIIQECRSLEGKLNCQGTTDSVLNSESSPKEVKKRILMTDWETCISTASQHNSTAVVGRCTALSGIDVRTFGSMFGMETWSTRTTVTLFWLPCCRNKDIAHYRLSLILLYALFLQLYMLCLSTDVV